MPASPSERRGRWKRRRRGGLVARRPKREEDEVEDEEEENNNDEEEAEVENGDEPQQNGIIPSDPGPGEGEVLAEARVRISDFPAAVRRGVLRPHASVMAIAAEERASLTGEGKGQHLSSMPLLENISHGQLQALSTVPVDSPALLDQDRGDGSGGGASSYVISPPQIMEGKGVAKHFGTRVHEVPMHSDWFSPDTVNRLERQVVPHFFSGKSHNDTPEKYMECRNRIVAKYMDHPEKTLTLHDCQGLVDGVSDEDLARIMRFLDNWGIINYCSQPNGETCSGGSYLREDLSGEVHVPSAALKSIDSLIKFEKPKCSVKASDAYSAFPCHDDDLSNLDRKIREQLCENHCNHCSKPLPTIYYQSQKEGDVFLCSNCFHDGRFVIGHSSIDFVRVDSAKSYADVDGESWSDQETLLLLEAVELYHENWNEIAEHVGSKSKAQCILHFLRLPVEDGMLESIELPRQAKSSEREACKNLHSNGDISGSSEPDSDEKLPFANSANPVMSLVAFLASAVGPRVAAACAHASLASLSEDDCADVNIREGSGHDNRTNPGNGHSQDRSLPREIQQKDESLTGQRSLKQNGSAVATLPTEKVKEAARAGLSAAATKAKLFADHEEREIQRLSAAIINHQLKRLELKLKQFAEIETLLMKECEQVEKARQRLVAERARMLATRFGPSGAAPQAQANQSGPTPSVLNNSMAMNRQMMASAASSSRPAGISGFDGGSQPGLIPRHSMFPMGPRLPLNAIQTNASGPANTFFGSTGANNANPQPSFNHAMLRSMSGTSTGLG